MRIADMNVTELNLLRLTLDVEEAQLDSEYADFQKRCALLRERQAECELTLYKIENQRPCGLL